MKRLKNYAVQIAACALILMSFLVYSKYSDNIFGEKSVHHVVLTADNTVTIDSEINNASMAEALTKARTLKNCPIYLFLNTPGGSVQAGLDAIDTLKGLNCRVNTVSRWAASMGFQMIQNLGDRMVLPNGVIMSHHPHGEFYGEYGGKRPAQIDSRIGINVAQFNELDNITVARTKGKQTLFSYQEAYNPELWLTAQQAIEGGYADSIVTASCDDSLNGTKSMTVDYENEVFNYEKSNCPLVSGPLKVDVKLATTEGAMTFNEFVSKGGELGPFCLRRNKKLCALDTTITTDKIKELKKSFLLHYADLNDSVVDYR